MMTTKTENRELKDDVAVVDTIIMFMNNVSYDKVFGIAYGETEDYKHHANYRDEKIGIMTKRHLVGLWPMLDTGCRHRLLKAAMEKYHGECYSAATHNAEQREEELNSE
jgi:hypothetical protein